MRKTLISGNQGGMTYLGMLILMIFVAFGAIIAIKVVPLYLEHFKVESSLSSLSQVPQDELAGMPPNEVEKLLLKRLSINDVEHVEKDDITITKEGGRTEVSIDYEARVTLFANIDVVLRFPNNRIALGGA